MCKNKNPFKCMCNICLNKILNIEYTSLNNLDNLIKPSILYDIKNFQIVLKNCMDRITNNISLNWKYNLIEVLDIWEIIIGNTWYLKYYKNFEYHVIKKIYEYTIVENKYINIFGKILWKKLNNIYNVRIMFICYRNNKGSNIICNCITCENKLNLYIKMKTKKMHDIIYDELIMIACHPDRVFNCNEYMCDLLPDRYKQECEKWNKLTYNS